MAKPAGLYPAQFQGRSLSGIVDRGEIMDSRQSPRKEGCGPGSVTRTRNHVGAGRLPPVGLLRRAAPLALLLLTGCGYQVRSSVQNLPGGIQSLGIPTFSNVT